MKKTNSYKLSLSVSIALHVVLIFFLITKLTLPNQPMPSMGQNQKPIINAVSVNQQQINQQIAKIKEEQRAKQRARAERLARYNREVEQARRSREQQQRRLAQLKAQQRKLQQQRIAAQQAADAKLAKLKQQQAAQQKALQKLQQQTAKTNAQKAQAAQQLAALKKQQQALAKQKQAELQQQKIAAQKKKDQQDLLAQQLKQEQQQLNASKRRYQLTIIDKYKVLILNAISQQWNIPANTNKKLSTDLLIRLAPNGAVLNVKLVKSSGDSALDRSAIAAVYKASPLPVPTNPSIFNQFRELNLVVRPETVMNG